MTTPLTHQTVLADRKEVLSRQQTGADQDALKSCVFPPIVEW